MSQSDRKSQPTLSDGEVNAIARIGKLTDIVHFRTMHRSGMVIPQDALEQSTDLAYFRQLHIDLEITFNTNMLKSTSNADDFGSFLGEEHDDLSMILLPTFARCYFPLIAAVYSIKVKPLALFRLPTECVQLSSFEHIQLEQMTPILDLDRIRSLLALIFSDKTVFSQAVSFRCLIGFEMPSADAQLKVPLSQAEEIRKGKFITIAIGITIEGIMYIYHNNPIQVERMHPEMRSDNQSVVISLLRAVIVTALSRLKISKERECDNVIETKSSSKNAEHIEIATDIDFLIVSVVVHAADTDLLISLQNLSLQVDEGKQRNQTFYFDALVLKKLHSDEVLESIIFDERDESNSMNCPIKKNADKMIGMRAANIDHIFLLMGQSNMAGRGKLEELISLNLDSSQYGELVNNVLLSLSIHFLIT